MIVVDTSVWVDFLNGVRTPGTEALAGLIEDDGGVALTEIVYTEILQGLGSERDAAMVSRHLQAFPTLKLEGLADFELATRLYRAARQAGVTVRKTLDLLIAAPCVRAGFPILHADRDFDLLAGCTALEIWTPDQRDL